MNLTKTVLKRPVTTLMVILCLIVFGLTSVLSSKLELIPPMDMPMLIVFTTYPGASPDDVDELVSQTIENETGTLNGIKGVTSVSNENYSIVLLEYEYGIDTNDAYDDLKKKMDTIQAQLPDDVQDPVIMEMNINDMPSITFAVNNDSQSNLYNYVNDTIVPENHSHHAGRRQYHLSGGCSQHLPGFGGGQRYRTLQRPGYYLGADQEAAEQQ